MATHRFDQTISSPQASVEDAGPSSSIGSSDVRVIVETGQPKHLIIAALKQVEKAILQSEWPPNG